MKNFPYRQIHLDFHTSEHIQDIGKDFNDEQFIGCLHSAKVNWINIFAKCHHGWSYYPTKVGRPHPNLFRKDLLGEMADACKTGGISFGIYISIQYDEYTARLHPEWKVSVCNQAPLSDNTESAENKEEAVAWQPICLSNGEYVDYVTDQAVEVIERYDPQGLWLDILNVYDCCCPNCSRIIKEKGLDPESKDDRLYHHRDILMDYYQKLFNAVKDKNPDIRLFHNSGHIFKGDRKRYNYFSHLELESLPTGGWGYDHFPVSVKYAAALDKELVGMTGRFHTMWGEFGGYKTDAALEYECCTMLAYGARCSIGDQLHPGGKMDEYTYRLIAPAYRRVAALEPFIENSIPVSEIALLSAEAHRFQSGIIDTERGNNSDDGAARMLMEMQEQFDIIDWNSDFLVYKLLILPDCITISDKRKKKILSFLSNGGALILSGSSGMTEDQKRFAIDIGAAYKGNSSPYSPDYILPAAQLDPQLPESPFVVYDRPYAVKAEDAEVLAESRLPYFNRNPRHFCSHQHTPYRLDRNEDYDAVIQKKSIVYFSHPIFRSYYKSGQPLLKYLLRGALNTLLPERRVRVQMPSCGRISFMKSGSRYLLHLICAQPQLRGHDVLPQKGHKQIEIIEDIIPIFDIPCKITIADKPAAIYSVTVKQAIPFVFEDSTLSFTIDRVYIHELIVIETQSGKGVPMGK